ERCGNVQVAQINRQVAGRHISAVVGGAFLNVNSVVGSQGDRDGGPQVIAKNPGEVAGPVELNQQSRDGTVFQGFHFESSFGLVNHGGASVIAGPGIGG